VHHEGIDPFLPKRRLWLQPGNRHLAPDEEEAAVRSHHGNGGTIGIEDDLLGVGA
jgi:hypothetical protein